ncbi:N/A [soil metagenome]
MKRDFDSTDLGVLRFMTCGSVDDGKSTLIGRLLFDTKTVLADTLVSLAATSKRRGLDAIDLSLLTDGLTAEREQGITIDVAYRYFATPRRSFIIADAPGHEQYTRNMVTAASTADAAILLVDARRGLLPQTRRHASIARLMGVGRLILAINKMDLVGYDRAVFERIDAEFRAWIGAGIEVVSIPMSALEGPMVVVRGEASELDWYDGPTLLDTLEATPSRSLDPAAALRLPVQWVCRPSGSDFRGYAGRLEQGALSVGDEVMVLPSRRQSRVTRIAIGLDERECAHAGQSIMVSLADEIDISRGDLLVRADQGAPEPRNPVDAIVCWLGHEALDPRRGYLLRHGTREIKARVTAIDAVLDLQSLEYRAAATVALNDIARLTLKTSAPLFADDYAIHRAGGAFILIDESTNDTVAAGRVGAPA